VCLVINRVVVNKVDCSTLLMFDVECYPPSTIVHQPPRIPASTARHSSARYTKIFRRLSTLYIKTFTTNKLSSRENKSFPFDVSKNTSLTDDVISFKTNPVEIPLSDDRNIPNNFNTFRYSTMHSTHRIHCSFDRSTHCVVRGVLPAYSKDWAVGYERG